MEITDLVAKISDPYERKARLYPALLALLPLIVIGAVYAPKASAPVNVVMFISGCGGLFLMANISRELGKRLESTLSESWGGKPTTQLLRHRDGTIDTI